MPIVSFREDCGISSIDKGFKIKAEAIEYSDIFEEVALIPDSQMDLVENDKDRLRINTGIDGIVKVSMYLLDVH